MTVLGKLSGILACPAMAAILAFCQAGWLIMSFDLPATAPPGRFRELAVQITLLEVCVTVLLGSSLALAARRRGHAMAWGAMALLGPIGTMMVHCLPDRIPLPERGFPIEPTRGDP